MRKVIILSGIPGSGKSYYAQKKFRPSIVFSADHFFLDTVKNEYIFKPKYLNAAHEFCFRSFHKYITSKYCNQKLIIVIDNTNMHSWEIAPYYMLASVMNCSPEIHRINCDINTAIQRQIHNVPEEKIKQMYEQFQRCDILPWWKVKEVNNEV